MASEDKNEEITKYLRENITDIQAFAKKKLAKKGMDLESEPTDDPEAWNIRNWGNFYDASPYFSNH